MNTVKKGTRNGINRFKCKTCNSWFSINHKRKEPRVLTDHIDGKPLRTIAAKAKQSKSKVGRKYLDELKQLPDNNEVTYKYCNRFCGILVVDGKYVKVKGYEKKIPLLWGIDYLTHDIPVFVLARSESYAAWLKYFGYLKSAKYNPSIIICDDNENIYKAAKYIFPNIILQTCQVHFMENIRKLLSVRTDEKYKPFVLRLKKELFSFKLNIETFRKRAFYILKDNQDNPILVNIMLKIDRYTQELTAAHYVQNAPRDTNLIELYNSHLQARLKSIKGFKSFQHAKLWLNAYILRRRFKRFTDCSRKFRYLNGKSSISQTLKRGMVLTSFFD